MILTLIQIPKIIKWKYTVRSIKHCCGRKAGKKNTWQYNKSKRRVRSSLVGVSSHFRSRLLRHLGHRTVRWLDLDLCRLHVFCMLHVAWSMSVRPKRIVFGRTSVLRLVFFFIFSCDARSPRCVSRPAWNFARWSLIGLFYNVGPKFWGTHPKKISGAKNMQNLARFRKTSKFGGEYLRNGWRYSKSDGHSVYRDSSCVRRNKSGKVWSSNLGDVNVESYPPKVHFSEDHISALRGCYAPTFLHALKIDQVLLAHRPPGTAALLTTFFKGGSKIGLKWNK